MLGALYCGEVWQSIIILCLEGFLSWFQVFIFILINWIKFVVLYVLLSEWSVSASSCSYSMNIIISNHFNQELVDVPTPPSFIWKYVSDANNEFQMLVTAEMIFEKLKVLRSHYSRWYLCLVIKHCLHCFMWKNHFKVFNNDTFACCSNCVSVWNLELLGILMMGKTSLPWSWYFEPYSC